MTWLFSTLGFDLIWVFVWGAAVATAYVVLSWTVDLLPLGDDRRALVARLKPVAAAVLTLTYTLFSFHALFARYEVALPFALLLVLVGFFVGCRGLISDLCSGVALRAEQSCQVGDHVQVGETRGRITELGPRALTLETPEGDRAVVPYATATRAAIVRTRAVDSGASRTFVLPTETEVSCASLCELVNRTTLLHHWGSVVRTPKLTQLAEGALEVTVFALGQQHTQDLEEAVRSALAASKQASHQSSEQKQKHS